VAIASLAGALGALPASGATLAGRSRATTAAHIYWSEPESSKGPSGSGIDNIWRADTNGTHVNRHFITGFQVPGAIAVHGSYIYFSDSESGVIGRARTDGTHVNLDLINRPADALAVTNRYIYWTNGTQSNPAIWRANLDGSHIHRLLSVGSGTYFGGLAVQAGHIYWTNRDKGTVGRAELGGTQVRRHFITGLKNPTGLAAGDGHLYWAQAVTAAGRSSIGRADVSGSGVQKRFITGVSYPFGVAIGSGHIYWGDEGAGTIGRALLAGTHVQPSFITAQPMFMGSAGAEPFDVAVGP
jgi:hypothetical protein